MFAKNGAIGKEQLYTREYVRHVGPKRFYGQHIANKNVRICHLSQPKETHECSAKSPSVLAVLKRSSWLTLEKKGQGMRISSEWPKLLARLPVACIAAAGDIANFR